MGKILRFAKKLVGGWAVLTSEAYNRYIDVLFSIRCFMLDIQIIELMLHVTYVGLSVGELFYVGLLVWVKAICPS